nr:MAG TPA: hypothetical protein [Bacteriophage sp.]
MKTAGHRLKYSIAPSARLNDALEWIMDVVINLKYVMGFV